MELDLLSEHMAMVDLDRYWEEHALFGNGVMDGFAFVGVPGFEREMLMDSRPVVIVR
jgi:hypothetical protein